MPTYWTTYWKEKYWLKNDEYQRCTRSGGSYRKRNMKEGDVVYIVSQRAGKLLLGGRMIVGRIQTRDEAVRDSNRPSLYLAPDWIKAKVGSGSPLHLHRELHPAVTKKLRFLSKAAKSIQPPVFVSDGKLDPQTTRIPRRLTPESAALFDKILEITDGDYRPRTITLSDLR